MLDLDRTASLEFQYQRTVRIVCVCGKLSLEVFGFVRQSNAGSIPAVTANAVTADKSRFMENPSLFDQSVFVCCFFLLLSL